MWRELYPRSQNHRCVLAVFVFSELLILGFVHPKVQIKPWYQIIFSWNKPEDILASISSRTEWNRQTILLWHENWFVKKIEKKTGPAEGVYPVLAFWVVHFWSHVSCFKARFIIWLNKWFRGCIKFTLTCTHEMAVKDGCAEGAPSFLSASVMHVLNGNQDIILFKKSNFSSLDTYTSKYIFLKKLLWLLRIALKHCSTNQ